MKLTGTLKEKVEKAENAAAAKELIAEAGIELTDDELENITGGSYATWGGIYTGKPQTVPTANPIDSTPKVPNRLRAR